MLHVHHIGYLIKNIERARDAFSTLGFQVEQDVVYDHDRDIDILFMKNAEEYRIELVMPKSDSSVVSRMAKTYKNTPYHICYASDSFDQDIEFLNRSGFTQIGNPAPAPALGNCQVCFFMSSHVGLVEIADFTPALAEDIF